MNRFNLVALIFLTGCSSQPEVGDCYNLHKGPYKIILIGQPSVFLENLKTHEYIAIKLPDLNNPSIATKVDCSILQTLVKEKVK